MNRYLETRQALLDAVRTDKCALALCATGQGSRDREALASSLQCERLPNSRLLPFDRSSEAYRKSLGPDQHCPTELSATMEILSICSIQYGSHWQHLASEHLNYG